MRRRGKGEKEWPTVGKLFVACFARSRFLKNREERRRVNPGCSSGETRLQILKNRSYSRSLNSSTSPILPATSCIRSSHSHTHTHNIFLSNFDGRNFIQRLFYFILFYFLQSNFFFLFIDRSNTIFKHEIQFFLNRISLSLWEFTKGRRK